MPGGFINTGQVCASASRIYVERPLFADLVDALEVAMKGMTPGAGLDPTADLNPLVSLAHQRRVIAHVEEARASGAEIRYGAKVPDHGYFASPALVLNPATDSRVAREEVFGPVLGITAVADADEAIAAANASAYGLAASLWTRDVSDAMRFSSRLQAGTVWINAHVFIDPAMPFGGYKQSGIGRDFGVDWLHAYTEEKSVCIAH